jgi:hypothetical protein
VVGVTTGNDTLFKNFNKFTNFFQTFASVVVRPAAVGRIEEGFDGVFVAGSITTRLAALAQALVRLDMRAGRHFLQINFNGFGAFGAFEGQDAGRFGHGGRSVREKRAF